MDEVIKLKAKIYENNILDRYEAIGASTGETYYLSVDQVKFLASKGLVYGVKLDFRQYKLLINSDFCKLIEDSFEGKIRNRYVIYLGEGKDVTSGSYTIKYRNVSDFLKAL